jgi:hypothetical protein
MTVRFQFVCFGLSFLLFPCGIVAFSYQATSARPTEGQVVFADLGFPDAEVVMDVHQDQLRIRDAVPLPASASCYLEDRLKYCKDLQEIESNYKEHEVVSSLSIQDGALRYAGAPVSLPSGVKMRLIWQAVLWKGWVICLGRTSNTDKPANMIPPFFATELISFSVSKKMANVRYLSFNPPGDIKLYILNPRK